MKLDWLDNTRRHVFSNGLTLLTHQLPNSEAASLHFCVKAGYFCETDSEVGLAHLLEHMYFKGSLKYPQPGTIGIVMKALGGIINATTSYDQTNYFCEVPAENLMAAIDIMGDAFLAPLFPSDELKKECEVVIEEFNRKIDSPAAYSQEQLIRLAYTTHRMRRWRIGTPEQLRSYTRDHLFDYFRRYYQPQNMIITVAGKFEEDIVERKLQQIFSAMPSSVLKKDFGPPEPAQHELRYAQQQGSAMQSYLHMAVHAPGVFAPQSSELEFLSFLLSSGRSARLHRYLVETRRSASSVSCSYMSYEDIGLFMISAVCESQQIRDATRDIWTVLNHLLEHGISDDELKKVKGKLKLHQVMQTEDALNLAQLLSYYESYGGYEKIGEYLDTMQKMSEQQILQAAQHHLNTNQFSVLEFVNQNLPALDATEYRRLISTGLPSPQIVFAPPLQLQPSVTEINEGSTTAKPLIHKGQTTFILHPDESMPYISAGIFFRGGRNEEHIQNGGITQMLFRTVLKGTPNRNAEQLAFHFDALGNPPRFHCGRDFAGFTFDTLSEWFPSMWNLLLECLVDCRFPETEVETEKGKVIAAIRRNLDDNFVRPLQLFQRAYYGDHHPYSVPENGYEESIVHMNSSNLMDWRNRMIGKSRAIITVVGNFDAAMLLQQLESSLDALSHAVPEHKTPLVGEAPATREAAESREKKQTAFVLGFPAVPGTDPLTHRYEVLQQILAGMGGRLFINLRSKKSLAYSVFASNAAFLYSGTFLTYIAGEAGKEQQAYQAMWQELEQLKAEPVRAEELENAKNALIGGYTLSTQTAQARVLDYTGSYLYGRPLPYAAVYRENILQVTGEDVMKTAAETFIAEKSAIGIVRGVTGTTSAEKTVAVS